MWLRLAPVIPAKGGIYSVDVHLRSSARWIPAFAGMTAHADSAPRPAGGFPPSRRANACVGQGGASPGPTSAIFATSSEPKDHENLAQNDSLEAFFRSLPTPKPR